jgi:hypothetical protein
LGVPTHADASRGRHPTGSRGQFCRRAALGRPRSSCPLNDDFVSRAGADVIAPCVERPVARFVDDHGRLGRPPARIRVELRIDRDPALPQPVTLLPCPSACAHQARLLVRQSNDGVRVRLEVEPPRGLALVPAVHRERDEVRAVFDVADDDAALVPGPPPDARESQRTPAALGRRGPQEPAATEPVQRAMSAPGRVHEPRRWESRRSSCRVAHGDTSCAGELRRCAARTVRAVFAFRPARARRQACEMCPGCCRLLPLPWKTVSPFARVVSPPAEN